MAIKSDGFGERGGWWVVVQFAIFGLILLALTGNRTPSLVWQITGWVLVAVGGLGVLGGLWAIRDRLTALPAPISNAVLKQDGPYSVVRHPIYGGLILGFAGLAIKGGNPLALGLSLTLVPFFYAKTTVEERMLIAHFPDYVEYRARVRFRVLPWIL